MMHLRVRSAFAFSEEVIPTTYEWGLNMIPIFSERQWEESSWGSPFNENGRLSSPHISRFSAFSSSYTGQLPAARLAARCVAQRPRPTSQLPPPCDSASIDVHDSLRALMKAA